MIHKCAPVLFLVSIVLLASVVISCGGSSNSTPPPPCTGSFDVVGDWQGSITANGKPDAIFGTIDSTGSAVFFDSSADIAILNPITGACSFSSTLTAYQSIENGGIASASGNATGNVTSNTAINGSESVTSANGSFSLSSYSPLGTGSVTALSGLVHAEVEGQTMDLLTLTLGGTESSITYTGTSAEDCALNGTFTQEGSNNIYDVTFDVAGSSCTAGNLTGVGFESNSDLLDVNNNATGTYLYAVITSSGAPFVVEIPPTGASSIDHVARPHVRTSFPEVFGFSRRQR